MPANTSRPIPAKYGISAMSMYHHTNRSPPSKKPKTNRRFALPCR
jgi:hypothetical protein